MEKNMTLMRNRRTAGTAVYDAFREMCRLALVPVQWLKGYYSSVLERELSVRQTLLLVNVQLAFVFAVLPAEAPLLARAVCALWLWKAVSACRRSL